MEDGHKQLPTGEQVIGEQVDPAPYDAPRWYTPRRDIDWDAVDFGWAIYDRNRQTRLGSFLERVHHRLHLAGRWLRSIVQRRRGQ